MSQLIYHMELVSLMFLINNKCTICIFPAINLSCSCKLHGLLISYSALRRNVLGCHVSKSYCLTCLQVQMLVCVINKRFTNKPSNVHL